MKNRLTALETENEELRKEKQLLSQQVWNCRGGDADPNGFPTEQQQACGRCTGLQLEIDRLRDDARQFVSKMGPHVQAPLYVASSTIGMPSTSAAADYTLSVLPPQPSPSPRSSSGMPLSSSSMAGAGMPSHATSTHSQPKMSLSVAATPSSVSTTSPSEAGAHRASSTTTSFDAQSIWEQSVRSNGGDPSACCSGFFRCDVNGQVIVPSPTEL